MKMASREPTSLWETKHFDFIAENVLQSLGEAPTPLLLLLRLAQLLSPLSVSLHNLLIADQLSHLIGNDSPAMVVASELR